MSEPDRPLESLDANTALDEDFALASSVVAGVIEALNAGEDDQVRALVTDLHYSDTADLLEYLSADDRRRLIDVARPALEPEVLPELAESLQEEVMQALGFVDFSSAVAELESDDAVYVMSQLDPDQRLQVLERLPPEDRTLVEQGLSYPEDSIGRRMQRELVAVPAYWTVGEAIDYMRSAKNLPDDFYAIFVVSPHHRPIGTIRLSRLLRSQRTTALSDIIDTDVEPLPVQKDKEDAAYLFRQRDLLTAPVVDGSGRLVGRLTIDDIVDIIDEEAEEDILAMGGISETDLFSAIKDSIRARLSWLGVNLVTAVIASIVIGLFEPTLEAIVALAILMPIVASMGGNAGTQSMTTAVRGLAMRELDEANAKRVIGKEAVIGLVNGSVFAVATGAVTYIWFGRLDIGLVIAAAMVINMVAGNLAGIVIPLILNRFGIDPAAASGVLLTTVTDVIGFLAFLGLAAAFLL